MLKATRDFSFASISIKAGEEIKPYQFEADQVFSLLAQGLIEDADKKAESAPKEPQVTEIPARKPKTTKAGIPAKGASK